MSSFLLCQFDQNGLLMPSDILRLSLHTVTRSTHRSSPVSIRFLDAASRTSLAKLYFEGYPLGVAAEDMASAREEIDAVFRGDYGALRPDACATAWVNNRPVGAVMVVDYSIWDEWLDGPFIIDLFVHPHYRGLGAGRALVLHAIEACSLAGNAAISLRFGDGTSPAAMGLYKGLGFVPYPSA
ncbi:GNAT family N-acetyltransferase [Kocuria tytonicola]|uniref:GNAT family N-acetyltransferase n=1 Tax=Kocuria tytonicola TaxID=2055946 RepID=UPI000F53E353|nr:GNAT family N-acetyltransferase [Kocuria tytonicola]